MAETSAGRQMKNQNGWRRAMSLCLAGLLAGCAGLPMGDIPAPDAQEPGHGQGPAAPSSRLPGEPQLPPGESPALPDGASPDVSPEPDYHPAGEALIDAARQEAMLGRDAAAGASLERALRIDSQNPWIWIELGKLRLAAGDLAAARNMAQKARSLAQRDPAARAAADALLRQSGGGS